MTDRWDKDPINRYYFYHSAIGDLERIVMKHVVPEVEPTPGFLTNAFGVKVNPHHLPEVIGGMEGVEPPPIPANWHADMAEFGSALRAVDLAQEQFTIVELGCGWGCWMNITGVAAKRKGLRVSLIGVEGDAGHVEFVHQSLKNNGFCKSEYVVHHGIASASPGFALFPIQDQSGVSWGLQACFDVPDSELSKLLQSGKYLKLKQVPLHSLLPDGCNRIDLVHVDIQGAEIPLIPSSMEFLNEKVGMVLIGTHSRQIEAGLFDCFQSAGWVLEVERPAVLAVGRDIHTLVDGVQLWRNPRVLPDETMPLHEHNDYLGKLEVVSFPKSVRTNEEFFIGVNIVNQSGKNWYSSGDNPIHLSYHWLSEDGEVIIFDGIRTKIDGGKITRSSFVTQNMRIVAPERAGLLELVVTLVHEGICWFGGDSFDGGSVEVAVH